MNDQLTIWGGSTATGLPVTNPVRKAKRTSQGGVVIPLFRKAAPANPRNQDAPTKAVEECLTSAEPPQLTPPIAVPCPRTSSGEGPGASPTRPGQP